MLVLYAAHAHPNIIIYYNIYIQRQICDACLNTVGHGKNGGLNRDGDSA